MKHLRSTFIKMMQTSRHPVVTPEEMLVIHCCTDAGPKIVSAALKL